MYNCINCGKEVSEEELKKRIRCPYCGYRILLKRSPEIVKKVRAR